MSQDAVGIIKAASEAATWARAHGCVVDIHIGRSLGRGQIDVKITPVDVEVQIEDEPAALSPAEPIRSR